MLGWSPTVVPADAPWWQVYFARYPHVRPTRTGEDRLRARMATMARNRAERDAARGILARRLGVD